MKGTAPCPKAARSKPVTVEDSGRAAASPLPRPLPEKDPARWLVSRTCPPGSQPRPSESSWPGKPHTHAYTNHIYIHTTCTDTHNMHLHPITYIHAQHTTTRTTGLHTHNTQHRQFTTHTHMHGIFTHAQHTITNIVSMCVHTYTDILSQSYLRTHLHPHTHAHEYIITLMCILTAQTRTHVYIPTCPRLRKWRAGLRVPLCGGCGGPGCSSLSLTAVRGTEVAQSRARVEGSPGNGGIPPRTHKQLRPGNLQAPPGSRPFTTLRQTAIMRGKFIFCAGAVCLPHVPTSV